MDVEDDSGATKREYRGLDDSWRTAVRESLDGLHYENAQFLAETLWAHASCGQAPVRDRANALRLLIEVYARTARPAAVCEIAERELARLEWLAAYGAAAADADAQAELRQARYLYAQALYQQDRLEKARQTLSAGVFFSEAGGDESTAAMPRSTAAECLLMGHICRRSDLREKARQCYRRCLELNPLYWAAYSALCQLGDDVDLGPFVERHLWVEPTTGEAAAPSKPLATSSGVLHFSSPYGAKPVAGMGDSSSPSAELLLLPPRSSLAPSRKTGSRRVPRTGRDTAPDEDSGIPRPMLSPLTVPNGFPGPAPLTPTLTVQRDRITDLAHRARYAEVVGQLASQEARQTPVGKGAPRGLDEPIPADLPRAAPIAQLMEAARARSRRQPYVVEPPILGVDEEPRRMLRPGVEAQLGLPAADARLLTQFGRVWRHFTQYRFGETLEALEGLADEHAQGPWALHVLGEVYYASGQYGAARKRFKWLRRIAPWRTQGMELYSSVLWQLRREVELSYLAQQILKLSRFSAETWCVLGNAFSLQKDTRTALQFFQRATQVDPYFSYAYVLAGHEYMAGDDLEKATAAFRRALVTNERHFVAWYGLGAIYLKRERVAFAEYHFRRAAAINPCSSILFCFLANVHKIKGEFAEALRCLETALELDPRNMSARYKRAYLLFRSAVDAPQRELALDEANLVADLAPQESVARFLQGVILRALGRSSDALVAFTCAMDLDQKNVSFIKRYLMTLDSEETLPADDFDDLDKFFDIS